MKSIGEVAARFGLPAHVLRYWEAEGLLAPARAGARRRYTEADLRRVAAILVAKEAGWELADIRSMLTDRSAAGRAAMAARQRERLRTQIARAQAALELLEGDCTHDDLMACPHFQGLLRRQLERS
ncbi:MerR family transcriptional regulator [Amycolatopsis vancoresmycina]|uniref:MerR family transcriptional regulator n=1 Tax=Amycolatopsis vancoresmycina DSM 44592 TaxID=1292037 RepID=R1HKN3_9PSEU|nr:MerR family transcriptional regulator [Amycolatopsis vancoresmycina]EOD58974.1 MerR family transcriptional regulator [Amycolatopsis vancoresmycina DSM 44592]